MSGCNQPGAGSFAVSLVLSRNRLPNYKAMPATPSSCQLLHCPSPVPSLYLQAEESAAPSSSLGQLSRKGLTRHCPLPGVQPQVSSEASRNRACSQAYSALPAAERKD